MEMQNHVKLKSGIVLIILSAILFSLLLAVPFIDTGSKNKIIITTIIIILGEVTFWIGGILLGKELFDRYKAYFNPLNWFKKK
jgi:hypothetical protein